MRRIFAAVALLFALFIAWVIWQINFGRLPRFLRLFYTYPGGDKIGHFFLLGTLALLINLALGGRTLRIGPARVYLGSAALAILITLEEISQIFIRTRSFDLLDLSANYFGIALLGSLVYFIKK